MAGILRIALVALSCMVGTQATLAEIFETEHYLVKAITVADGLEQPWALAWLPDGRMLITERPGMLRVVRPNGEVSKPVAGLPEIAAGGQGGLLDIAVDPAFERNRRVYFSFSESGPRGTGTAVGRAALTTAGLRDLQIIFRQIPKTSGGRHFGSRIAINPDGTLFVTVGERGQREQAQDLTDNLGQVVRIGTDGAVPADNPFVGRRDVRPEIWSFGHRNPQGATLHPDGGALWIHEHGARGGDEINIIKPGVNYGWPVISYGRHYWGGKIGIGHTAPDMVQPIHYWDPSIAPSGMTFYTGDVFPKWRGNLLIGALKARLLVRLILAGNTVVGEERLLTGLRERIRDVRQGPDGHVYILTDARDGRLLRLDRVDP